MEIDDWEDLVAGDRIKEPLGDVPNRPEYDSRRIYNRFVQSLGILVLELNK